MRKAQAKAGTWTQVTVVIVFASGQGVSYSFSTSMSVIAAYREGPKMALAKARAAKVKGRSNIDTIRVTVQTHAGEMPA